MLWARKTIILLGFFILGCSPGTPTISATEDLPPIELDQNFFQSKKLDLYDISFKGKVAKFVDRLEVSFDGGGSWTALPNSGVSALQIDKSSCTQKCPFNFGVLNIGQQWPMLMQLPLEAEAAGLVRGYSVYGFTQPTPFRVKRLKPGFVAVGSVGNNNLGNHIRKTTSGFFVEGGKLESRSRTTMSGGAGGAGVVQ